MMRRLDAALGVAVALGGAAALPAFVGATSGGVDLEVRAPAPYELRASPTDPSRSVSFVPTERVQVEHSLAPGASGLDLVSYSATYGEAWKREITWPTLTGPFAAEGSDVCGYSLRLGAGLFDTAHAGGGLKDIVIARVAKLLPPQIVIEEYDIRVDLAPVRRGEFTITLQDGWATIRVALWLGQDKKPLSIAFPARLVSAHGALVVERVGGHDPVVTLGEAAEASILRQASAKGGTYGLAGCVLGPLGCLAGWLLGSDFGEKRAKNEIPRRAGALAAAEIDESLVRIALGLEELRQPWHFNPKRPGDVFKLRLARNPVISPGAITLPICVSATVAAPKIDTGFPGSVFTDSIPPEHAIVTDGSPTIAISGNADALNQVMYYLWQSGMLRDVGRSEFVLAGLSESVRMAAFDFRGFDPILPPTLDPRGSGDGSLPLVLGNVDVGTVGARTVLSHGQLGLRLQIDGEQLKLGGRVLDLRANCIEPDGAFFTFTPCLGDLVPAARDVVSRRSITYELAFGDLLRKITETPFYGMRVHVSDVRPSTSGGPLRVEFAANARIEAP